MKNIVPINPKPAPGATRPSASRPPQVIAITSGKGGVGKTNVTSNLAIALARQGHKVCIFDADTGLANINVLMGLNPRYTIEHLLNGEKTVDEILIEGPQGIRIVPAASGIAECANLDPRQRQRLISALASLEDRFDYILIDTAAGIGESVLSFIQSAQYAIVVISTEPTSLTDAFALLRVLKRRGYDQPVHVLVNMALNYADSMEVFKRFEAAVRKYLRMKVRYLGYITDDKAIKSSVGRQCPVILHNPDALASRCFTTLAAVLGKQFTAPGDPHGFSTYWSEAGAGARDPGGVAHPPAGTTGTAPAETSAVAALQALGARALTLMHEQPVDAAQAARFLAPLIEAYTLRFHQLPVERPGQLIRLIRQADYGEDELRRLVLALEALFEERFHRPVRPAGITQAVDHRAAHDRVLHEYRQIARRIAAGERQLQETLDRLRDCLDRECALPAAKGSGPEGSGPGDSDPIDLPDER